MVKVKNQKKKQNKIKMKTTEGEEHFPHTSFLFSFPKPKLSRQPNKASTKHKGKFSNKLITEKTNHLDLVPQT